MSRTKRRQDPHSKQVWLRSKEFHSLLSADPDWDWLTKQPIVRTEAKYFSDALYSQGPGKSFVKSYVRKQRRTNNLKLRVQVAKDPDSVILVDQHRHSARYDWF